MSSVNSLCFTITGQNLVKEITKSQLLVVQNIEKCKSRRASGTGISEDFVYDVEAQLHKIESLSVISFI